uniref:Uncharacterized protein n=1 Tax=Arundo donax TaxID=35708 RepID=A0A0A9N230_ARUDO
MFLQIILKLIIELRKALEVNMTTDLMEVKMYESYIFTEYRFNRFCISFIESSFTTMCIDKIHSYDSSIFLL